jgi:hypothetical protein
LPTPSKTSDATGIDFYPTRSRRVNPGLPSVEELVRDEQAVERLVRALDVALSVPEREGEVAGEQRVDGEPAQRARRRRGRRGSRTRR